MSEMNMSLNERVGEGAGGRLGYVDVAKVAALVMIVVSHCDSPEVALPFDNMSLALFFVCAGFTVKPDFSLGHRAARLLVPYVVLSAVCVAYSWCVNPGLVTWRSLLGVVYSRASFTRLDSWDPAAGGDLLMGDFNGVLWFLTAMFSGYVLFWLLLRLVRSVQMQAVVCAVGLMAVAAYSRVDVLLPWSLDAAPVLMAFMWLGHVLRSRGLNMGWGSIVGCVCVYAATYVWVGQTNYSVGDFGRSTVGAWVCGAAGSLALLGLCRKVVGGGRLWRVVERFNSQALTVFGLQLVFIHVACRCGVAMGLPGVVITASEIGLACVGGYLAGLMLQPLMGRL